MKSKSVPKRALLLFALAEFALSSILLFYFIPRTPAPNASPIFVGNTVVFPKKEVAGFGLPVRMRIPKINVDAAIDYVGLAPDGSMDVTESQENVMWFDLGSRPGDEGSAVIAGHYGWRHGNGSVFDELYKLRSGDKIYVQDDRGSIIPFIVREIRRYDPKADASRVFVSNDGKSHLNLVTCEGVLDKETESYSLRLVVFTDREN